MPVASTHQPQIALEEAEIHEILSNGRRRMVLDILIEESDDELALRMLADRIAERETADEPPPSNVRKSVYVSLHQTHLPKLDATGVVAYDERAKTVALAEQASAVTVYLETVPRYGISWSEYYVGISLVGLLSIVAIEAGVPLLAALDSAVCGAALFGLIALSATYQTIQQGSSIRHRLRPESD